jgi:photosystem II stability/assembly factor-like uncharacterized protein
VGDAGIQVQFVDENNGWALIHNFSSGNGSCLRTTDGGNNWSTIGTAGIFYFVDVNNGWAIGSPNIYHTTNGGTDWSVQYTDATPGGFKTIQFTDLDNGWIVGDSSKILKTTNGGSNWMQIANTVSGIKYKGLFFLDANIGWIGGPISGHMPGLLLYTSNGGSSWTTQSFPMDNEDNVWSIFFWDANNGWFTSDGGKIGHTTNSGSTGVEEGNKSIPSGNSLSQNYPNPFNPSTNISFKLTKLSFVSLKIFDLLGREVATIVSEQLSTGNHVRQWNAMNMPSGVYFYRLQSDSFTETKKLILLK